MQYSLRELGYPSLERLAQLGFTGSQFLDIVKWLQRGRKCFGYGWLRRAHVLTGWEVLDFIKSIDPTYPVLPFCEEALLQTCTRQVPHVCTENGPCNGFPRREYPVFGRVLGGRLDEDTQTLSANEGLNGRMPTRF
jgi:hypothetical protein